MTKQATLVAVAVVALAGGAPTRQGLAQQGPAQKGVAQQWIAPRVAERAPSVKPTYGGDPWIRPAAAYQPPGRVYAIDDAFAGQPPIGQSVFGGTPTSTVPAGGVPFGPVTVGQPNYVQAPMATQGFVSPSPTQPGFVQPTYTDPTLTQPNSLQSGWVEPCPPMVVDPYAYSVAPAAGAPLVSLQGAFRRPYAELEGRIGDNPNSLHSHLFLPFFQQADSFWFADLRGQWDDDDAREYNAGVAWRRRYGDMIVGLYGFYDYRETRFDNEFQGATVGAEVLDLNWEARLNWYIPEGGSKASGQPAVASINTNNAIVVQNSIERAYYGFDAEVGRLLWGGGGLYDAEVRGFVGGYYFNNNSAGFTSFGGPRVRLEGRLYDLPRLGPGSRLTLGGVIQYDDVRDTQGIASINLRIPFGAGTPAGGTKLSPFERRMLSPIRRDDDIVTLAGLGAEEQAVLVGNGDDGRMLTDITEINGATADVPTAVASGTSNVVVTGDINTANAIVLNEGQFLGGAFDVRGQTTGRTATFGSRPTITATGASAVQIADSTIVAGLNINAAGSGIVGGADDTRLPADADALADGVNGFTITGNTITSTLGIAIDLDGTVNGDITGNELAADTNGLDIEVFQSGSISGNTATDDGTGTSGFAFDEITGGTVSGNTATGWGSDGFNLGALSGGTVSGNTATGNQAHGFFVSGTLSGGSISGNTASENLAEGFDLDRIDGASVTDNQATGNGGDGFDFDDGVLSGVIAGNTATGNSGDGFQFSGPLTGGVIDSNTATGNNTAEMGGGEGGFGGFNFFDPTDGGAGSVTLNGTAVTNNTSMNNGLDGFAFDEVQSGTVQGNTSTGDNTAFALGGNSGFSFNDVTGGTIDGNTATGGGGDGFVFFNSVTGGSITGNTATGAAIDGFTFVGDSGNSLQGSAVVTGNTASMNGDDGFEFSDDVVDGQIGAVGAANTASGNGVGDPAMDDDDGNGLGDGFVFIGDFGAVVVNPPGVDFNASQNNADEGFDFLAIPIAGGLEVGSITNNDAQGNAGLGYSVPGTGTGALNVNNNTGSGNTGGGDTLP